MRTSWLLLVVLSGSTAWADVPPGSWVKHTCTPDEGCVRCEDDQCALVEADAGRSPVYCQTTGAPSRYYCPPGKTVTQGCGCNGVDASAAFALVALLGARRRARS